MRRARVLSTIAVSLLALAILAWVVEQPGRALRAPASLEGRGDAAIGSGYTLQAVTSNRPRVAAAPTRAEGRVIMLIPPPTIVHDSGHWRAWVGALHGSATTTLTLGFGLSRRAPPSLLPD